MGLKSRILMKRIGKEELKMIQMDVLSAIHHFCLEHEIKYSLGCGSMLGCARHKGYIPWDDDIDIYMLREDYNKLIREFPDIYEEHYKFVTLERDEKWQRAYGKAYDSTTIIKEETTNHIPQWTAFLEKCFFGFLQIGVFANFITATGQTDTECGPAF